ncbi:MAG: YraN family protein [Pricia sp.]
MAFRKDAQKTITGNKGMPNAFWENNFLIGKHNEFGKEGEELAAKFLIEKGYSIQQKNYRHGKIEIDIIAQKGDVLAIVEVRARSSDHIIPIAETITPKKIQRLVRGANQFVTSRRLDVEVRFDIITILKNPQVLEIEHLENAFYHF